MIKRLATLGVVLGLLAAGCSRAIAQPSVAIPGAVAGNPEAAWAAAYGLFITRFCRTYEFDPDLASKSGAFPFGDDGPEWDENGTARLGFRAGGTTAQDAFRDDPAFCVHPLQAAGSHAPLVERFLISKQPR